MSGVKCSICNRVINLTDTMVRVVAEIVKRDPDKDGKDSEYFSSVLEWESFAAMHLQCARNKVEVGAEIPYGEEIAELALFEKEYDSAILAPVFKLVQNR